MKDPCCWQRPGELMAAVTVIASNPKQFGRKIKIVCEFSACLTAVWSSEELSCWARSSLSWLELLMWGMWNVENNKQLKEGKQFCAESWNTFIIFAAGLRRGEPSFIVQDEVMGINVLLSGGARVLRPGSRISLKCIIQCGPCPCPSHVSTPHSGTRPGHFRHTLSSNTFCRFIIHHAAQSLSLSALLLAKLP